MWEDLRQACVTLNLAADGARAAASGMGFADVDSNFEGTAGLQYQRILNSEGWMRLLNVHSGSSSANNWTGRPCVRNLPQVANTPQGRRPLYGDIKSGIGTLHPLGYEAVFNAKTASGLAFGLVDPLTSELLDVCAAQLDVDTYFHPGNADSFTPFFVASEQRTCFWICSSQDRKSIFDLPLPRALTGSIAPGAPLVHSDSGPSVDKESEKRAVLAHNKKEKAWLSRSVVADRRIKEFEVNTAVAEARKRNEIEALEARKKNEVECELLKSTTDTLLFKLKTAEGYGMHEEVITLKRKLRTLLG